MERKKLFLLDAYALIYRAYYALFQSPRITSKGLNVSAVFGFCNTLDEILRKESPDYIAVCFDPPGGQTFRHRVYPEYKAQRDKQPEDITIAVPLIKRILAAYNIQVVEMPDYEADDVIGSLAHMASEQGDFVTYMMTPDKDYGQLVDDNTFMYRPALKGKDFEIRGPKEVCERYGISSPHQVIDLLALEGDASDNIPGCPGVGEKTASKLIAQWGSVENLLANVDQLKGALRTKVTDNAEQIRFSKFLVTIKTDVPLEITPQMLERRKPDLGALLKIYEELEFKTFAARLRSSNPELAKSSQPAPAAQQQDGMQSLFDLVDDDEAAAAPAPLQPIAIAIDVLYDTESVAEMVAAAKKCSSVGMAIFAQGTEAMTANIMGIALNYEDKASAYIPLPPEGMGRKEIIDALRPLFDKEDSTATIVSNDIKRDMLMLRREGIEIKAPYFDTAIAHYILSPESNHRIDSMAAALLGYRTIDYDLTAADIKAAYAEDRSRHTTAYAEYALLVRQLVPKLIEEIDKQGQRHLLEGLELPFARVLAEMEWAGVRIDIAELSHLSRDLTSRLNDIENQIYQHAGYSFNISSPAQVGEVLFGQLQIDSSSKKTKKGTWSTTEEVLLKYRAKHPIVDLILEYRGLRKLLTTYVDALPKLINPATGKIHTTFNQTVTATGRISSANPNLQNIPIRTDEGREIRRAFIPDAGHLMLSADYSQIELRLMADLSGDPTMIEAFAEHEDIHRATAAKIYHIAPDEVTDNQRRAAKTANFGIIYGISAFGLAERLGISRAEAKQLIDGYMATYPGVSEYMQHEIEEARKTGYVTTIMKRKRFLPDINSRNAVVRGFAERNAVNAPLQGSAADIIKRAMIDIDREMHSRGMHSRMILQVHDELVFDVVPDERQELCELVEKLMSEAYKGRVPLEVGMGVGANWLEAH